MKKIIVRTICACMLFSISFYSFALGSKEQNAQSKTKEVIDHTGNVIVIPEKPERVVISSLLPLPSVYCLYLGGPHKLVGMHPSSKAAGKNSYLAKFYPSINDIDSSFVKNNVVNVEQLLELNPDLVLYNASNTVEKEMFAAAGIPCVGFSTTIAGYNTIETYASWIALLGEIFGDTGRSNEIIEYGRSVEKMVKERTSKLTDEQKPICLYLYSCEENSITTYGGNMFNQYWCETCGGKNASYELKGNNSLNMEQIYNWNPDMIFLTNFTPALPEDLYTNAIGIYDWSSIKAIKNKKVYKNPLGMYRWAPPSSDTPLALQWFAKQMQPELFSDIDMDKEIISYFKKFYGVELAKSDLQAIYNPRREASGK
ncbi:MAG: ABC transporter substrate-binding protein [Treponema sp.]|nr:ABC transporter substrate-binding protein [Treponema sp.]